MNIKPDHSPERIKFLAENKVWQEWCERTTPIKRFLKEYCKKCYCIGNFEAISHGVYECTKCGAIEGDDSNYVFIPLEHQHRAILRELGFLPKIYNRGITNHKGGYEYEVYLQKMVNGNKLLWLSRDGKYRTTGDWSVTAPTIEQGLDQTLIHAIEESLQYEV